MKTHRNLFHKVCAEDNLEAACYAAARGKRLRPEVAAFLFQREARLFEIRQQLLRGAYLPRPGRLLLIHEPKPRAITVTPFEVRVVHHAVCDVLEPLLARSYIHDTWACMSGRGPQRAVLRLLGFMRRHRFLLQLDVRKFFLSIPRDRLLERLGRRVPDPPLLRLVQTLIEHQAPHHIGPEVLAHLDDPSFCPGLGQGLAVGHLTSQVFGNFYLDPLDHFIKRELKVGAYLRYVDDLVLLADSRAVLWDWKEAVGRFLREELGLALNEARARIHPCTARVEYLGYRVGRDGLRPGRRLLDRVRRRVREAAAGPARPHQLSRLRNTLAAHRGLLTPL